MTRSYFFNIAVALLFSLTSFAQEIPTLSTFYGKGADTFVSNDDKNGPDKNFNGINSGGDYYLTIRTHDIRVRITYLKFDMSYIDTIRDAYLGLYISYADKILDNLVVSVYGMTNENEDDWADSLLTYNNAPGMNQADTNTFELNIDDTEFLTTFTVPVNDSGWIYSVPTQAMDDFINADNNELVTFILLVEEPNDWDELRVFSEEDTNRAPILFGDTIIYDSYQYNYIHDIQYTDSNDSEYINDTIRTSGIVTDTLKYGYYLQWGKGGWNGVYVQDSVNKPKIGDYIFVVVKVEEYNAQTQIIPIEFNKISSDNRLPEPLSVTDSLYEPLEGVLISVYNAYCVSEADGSGEWIVAFKNGDSIKVDDQSFEYTPGLGSRYQITGIVNYTNNEYKIAPRSIEDIIELNEDPVVINPLPDTSVFSGFDVIKLDLSDVFYDADGDSLMYEISYDSLGTFKAMIDYDGKLALIEDPMGSVTESYYGKTIIRIKAYDRLGGYANDKFLLTIQDTTNHAPVLINPISDIVTYPGFGNILTDLSGVFQDEDGDSLTYSVSDDSEITYTGINWDGINIVLAEETIVYYPYIVIITVEANDGRGGTASNTYRLIVNEMSTSLLSTNKVYSIYPNPTKGRLTIGMSGVIAADITVYDISGKLVQKLNASGSETTLDLSDAANGIYFVKITSDDEVVTRQVVKE